MAKYTLEELLAVVEAELENPDGERFTMLPLTKHILRALIDERKNTKALKEDKPLGGNNG